MVCYGATGGGEEEENTAPKSPKQNGGSIRENEPTHVHTVAPLTHTEAYLPDFLIKSHVLCRLKEEKVKRNKMKQ